LPAGESAGFGSLNGTGIPREKVLRAAFVLEEVSLLNVRYDLLEVPARRDGVRKESYFFYIVPKLNTVIAVCNERGNRSFVIFDVYRYWRELHLSKDNLTIKALHDEKIDHLMYSGEESFREYVRCALLHERVRPVESEEDPPDWVTEILPPARHPWRMTKHSSSLPAMAPHEATLDALAAQLGVPLRLADRLVADFFQTHFRQDNVALKRETKTGYARFAYSEAVQKGVATVLKRIPSALPGWKSGKGVCKELRLKPWQVRSLFQEFVDVTGFSAARNHRLMRAEGEVLDHYSYEAQQYIAFRRLPKDLQALDSLCLSPGRAGPRATPPRSKAPSG
jgi:hypothetical protein